MVIKKVNINPDLQSFKIHSDNKKINVKAENVGLKKLGKFELFLNSCKKFFLKKSSYCKVEVDGNERHVKISQLAYFLGKQPSEIRENIFKPEQFENYVQRNLSQKEIKDIQCQDAILILDKVFKEMEKNHGIKFKEKTKETIRTVVKVAVDFPDNTSEDPGEPLIYNIQGNVQLVFSQDETGVKVAGLFGKTIGKGAFGVVSSTTTIFGSDFAENDFAVFKSGKIPVDEKDIQNEIDIKNEVSILKKIHGEKKEVNGIQHPLRLVTYLGEGKGKVRQRHVHLGRRYSSDLNQFIKEKKVQKGQYLPIIKDLVSGLDTMHKANVFHGDIKPKNILCNHKNGNLKVHIADFGGAKDLDLKLKGSFAYSAEYTIKEELSTAIKKSGKEQNERFKAMDVYATCLTICRICGYNLMVGTEKNKVEAKEKLEKAEVPNDAIQSIIQGLNRDYKKRPTAEKLNEVIAGL